MAPGRDSALLQGSCECLRHAAGKTVIRPIAFKPAMTPSSRFGLAGERYGSTPILTRPGSRLTLYGSSSDLHQHAKESRKNYSLDRKMRNSPLAMSSLTSLPHKLINYDSLESVRKSPMSTADSSKPRTSITQNNISCVRRLIEDDKRLTTSEIASKVGISYGSTYSILTEELGYRKVCARWVPRLLTAEQKLNRLQFLEEEQEHLKQVLMRNGYSKSEIKKAMNPKRTRKEEPCTEKAYLPYVKSVTDKEVVSTRITTAALQGVDPTIVEILLPCVGLCSETLFIDTSNLTKDLHSLEHRRRVAGLSLFYRFYHGRCSSELSQIITSKAIRTRNTRGALHAHPYQVEVPTLRINLLQHVLEDFDAVERIAGELVPRRIYLTAI
nr:unnamed protein product [Callosobruchus analis]